MKTTAEAVVVGTLEIGLDGDSGHQRVAKAGDALLLGGSEETHERMQEMVIKVSESQPRRGKRIRDASVAELCDLPDNAQCRLGCKIPLPRANHHTDETRRPRTGYYFRELPCPTTPI